MFKWLWYTACIRMLNVEDSESIIRNGIRLFLRQISIFETKVTLLPLTPWALPVKINIYSLLIFFRNSLWLRMALEPCQVFHMESPWLTFQFSRSKKPVVWSEYITMSLIRTHTVDMSPGGSRRRRKVSRHLVVRICRLYWAGGGAFGGSRVVFGRGSAGHSILVYKARKK